VKKKKKTTTGIKEFLSSQKPKLQRIVIVIGQSASGKTTFVKENFVTDSVTNIEPVKLLKCCIVDKTILLGHYNVDKRCEGTDTLSYASLPTIKKYIPTILNKYETLVMEGDRISSKPFFKFIGGLNIPVELYLFITKKQESAKRRESSGSSRSEKFVKTTISKAMEMYLYGNMLGFKCQIIET
jgi:GTPase SAR1 family protein